MEEVSSRFLPDLTANRLLGLRGFRGFHPYEMHATELLECSVERIIDNR